ncbi:hypothetical protein K402DRAFT_388697 [Aulographum hederae CBS 113979]|uniref:Anaphase-promoting complex subunit CDC26 n=1 Tax=Aulographum hederae CBS 113979 TaxID=1176131 RepID=A0A6G1HFW8_9PEZI|nr:hypothetical protein K402DRAFT_388697 [Aulographum hederae CBS 113979]
MLRRPPTIISLTNDDVVAFNQARAQKLWQLEQAKAAQSSGISAENRNGKQPAHASDEQRPLPSQNSKPRTRDERIMGAGASASGSGSRA